MSQVAKAPDEAAQKIIDEIHSYVRHTLQLWMHWFVFFLTVNYLAMGWFAGEWASKCLENRRPLIYVAVLFVCQNTLGIVACCATRKWVRTQKPYLSKQYVHWQLQPPDFPNDFYAFAVFLGERAQVIVAIAWLVFALWPWLSKKHNVNPFIWGQKWKFSDPAM